ncbi:FAD-dependent oxidoreductase [Ferruginivarius sediminum]|uniref:FAD-dependent oxidoreductase n=1 Tax=Ferruginivarius sediminum TaxID=2661937 RepID=A0A369T7V9_9PROT|nr:FAD-dependent oxidoreductase [Ferruginivarius sediminum]RDD60972.1 FAD-dependent oxidoreductase [Ferruginivarius sediminum]
MQVAVAGAGVIGLSLARSLLQAGHEVTVYDRAEVPNPHASSVDRSRLIRYAYGRQAGYAGMVDDAYAAWDRLWAELGESHYVRTGTLVLAQPGATWARDSANALAAMGRPVEWLDPAEAEARYPLLDLTGVERAFYVPSGGVLHAERVVAALARRVRALGGTVREQCPVESVDTVSGRMVLADGTRGQADMLLLAPGPWAARLLPDLEQRLTPSRQVVTYGDIPPGTRAQWDAMPMVLDIGKDSGFYAVPPVLGEPLKVGDHSFSLQGDPDWDREPGADELRGIFESAGVRLKGFDAYRLRDGRTCFYTVAAEERFVVEQRGRAAVFAGFSGHGFKFGPLIGERFAEVAAGRRSFESFARWAEGEGG